MSFLEFTEDEKLPAELAGKQAVAQHSKPNYPAALAWAMGGLLVAGVLLYIAAPKQVSQPRELPLTAASQTETPEIIAKNVEDIQAGDVVVSYDEATGEQVFNRVVETYERTSFHLRFIETRSLESGEVQTFETTDEHPFWQVDIGWVDAGKLKPGDQLLQSNGQLAEVVSTRYEARPEGVTVYNFQVADSHSYYVSAPTTRGPPVLVHNANAAYTGAKRGPKTNPNAPHNTTIRTHGELLEAGGNTVIAGGGKVPERLIKTPGGIKEGRRPDILFETVNGELRGRNVGLTDASGKPIKRELDALQDLNGPGGIPTDFVPYD